MMDRPLYATVLCTLYLEWGNPRCCVPVLRAQVGDCKFRSAKNNLQGGKKKMRNIGTDVGKKKFIVCVMDDKEKILEGTAYDNTLEDAKEFAG